MLFVELWLFWWCVLSCFVWWACVVFLSFVFECVLSFGSVLGCGTGVIVTTGAIKGAEVGFSNPGIKLPWQKSVHLAGLGGWICWALRLKYILWYPETDAGPLYWPSPQRRTWRGIAVLPFVVEVAPVGVERLTVGQTNVLWAGPRFNNSLIFHQLIY